MHMVEDATGRIMIHVEYVVSTCILQHGATSEVVFSVVEIPIPLSLPLSGLLAEVGVLLLNHVAGGQYGSRSLVFGKITTMQVLFLKKKRKFYQPVATRFFFSQSKKANQFIRQSVTPKRNGNQRAFVHKLFFLKGLLSMS